MAHQHSKPISAHSNTRLSYVTVHAARVIQTNLQKHVLYHHSNEFTLTLDYYLFIYLFITEFMQTYKST